MVNIVMFDVFSISLWAILLARGCALKVNPSGSLPSFGKVAVLVRGMSFRTRGLGDCLEWPEVMKEQAKATNSIVEMIAKPLEQRNNVVKLFVINTVCPTSPSIDYARSLARTEFADGLGRQRHVVSKTIVSINQTQNFREVINLFQSASKSDIYDLIIITRHDMRWVTPINMWKDADFTKFNFFAHCERTQTRWTTCVDDKVHVMPGRVFDGFQKRIGEGHCFSRGTCSRPCGHGCYSQISDAMARLGVEVGFLTPWRPKINLREMSDLGGLTCNHCSPTYYPPLDREVAEREVLALVDNFFKLPDSEKKQLHELYSFIAESLGGLNDAVKLQAHQYAMAVIKSHKAAVIKSHEAKVKSHEAEVKGRRSSRGHKRTHRPASSSPYTEASAPRLP